MNRCGVVLPLEWLTNGFDSPCWYLTLNPLDVIRLEPMLCPQFKSGGEACVAEMADGILLNGYSTRLPLVAENPLRFVKHRRWLDCRCERQKARSDLRRFEVVP